MPRTAFIVMGFGPKTDHRTKRLLDMDKTYNHIIKPAVERAGLLCVRSDGIAHSGVIDKPMYEHLLGAEVVIADLSTSNENAIYELGVRHALRPNTTIIIAEQEFKFPFDLSHVVIRSYRHDGHALDIDEANRMREALGDAIEAILATQAVDSPVYTFLPSLQPPTPAPVQGTPAGAILESTTGSPALSTLREQALAARAKENWSHAAALWTGAVALAPNDAYLRQQLALATYKGKQPTPLAALLAARDILAELHPESTGDPETLGLWGAIHKRLYELQKGMSEGDEALAEATRAYGRGWDLRRDHYTGINYAFLLNVRAARGAADRRPEEREECHADLVLARRVRTEIVEICTRDLRRPDGTEGIYDEEGKLDRHETFWRKATLAEAYAGLGRKQDLEAQLAWATANAPEPWMLSTLKDQVSALERWIEDAEAALLRARAFPTGTSEEVYLVHAVETVQAPAAAVRGTYRVTLRVEAYKPALLDEINEVKYRLYQDDFAQPVVESTDRSNGFAIVLLIYGEFNVVATATRPGLSSLWLTRYLDLPGRPTD